MAERPIIFSGESVRAILEERKTMTRRVVKPPPGMCFGNSDRIWWDDDVEPPGGDGQYRGCAVWECDDMGGTPEYLPCPYGQPGDRLWVRESGYVPPDVTDLDMREGADTWPKYVYTADNPTDIDQLKEWGWKSRPSIHMPRWASRITLEITGVRVERVQDISRADAAAEGTPLPPTELFPSVNTTDKQLQAFPQLWDTINGKRGYSWDSNPWVWVVEFRRVEAGV